MKLDRATNGHFLQNRSKRTYAMYLPDFRQMKRLGNSNGRDLFSVDLNNLVEHVRYVDSYQSYPGFAQIKIQFNRNREGENLSLIATPCNKE